MSFASFKPRSPPTLLAQAPHTSPWVTHQSCAPSTAPPRVVAETEAEAAMQLWKWTLMSPVLQAWTAGAEPEEVTSNYHHSGPLSATIANTIQTINSHCYNPSLSLPISPPHLPLPPQHNQHPCLHPFSRRFRSRGRHQCLYPCSGRCRYPHAGTSHWLHYWYEWECFYAARPATRRAGSAA